MHRFEILRSVCRKGETRISVGIAGVALALLLQGCTTAWISAWLAERERAESMRPTWTADESSGDETAFQPIRAIDVVTVRVHADRTYRTQVPGWQREIRRCFAAANRLLDPVGVRLDVVKLVAWERDSNDSNHENLRDLEKHDQGEGTSFVVGFVSGLTVFTEDLHRLGSARLLGKHAVVRAIDDRLELEHLMRSLRMHSQHQVERIYADRRWHKKGVLLVHEWAHTLGAVHETNSAELFMYPFIQKRQHRFSRLNEGLIRIGLRHRPAEQDDQGGWGREALALFRGEPKLNGEHREVLPLFERMATGATAAAKGQERHSPRPLASRRTSSASVRAPEVATKASGSPPEREQRAGVNIQGVEASASSPRKLR